jgi:hypothetical protein
MRPLLLSLVVLLGLSQFTNALYFYLNAGENRCFLEELPKDTIVVGTSYFLSLLTRSRLRGSTKLTETLHSLVR